MGTFVGRRCLKGEPSREYRDESILLGAQDRRIGHKKRHDGRAVV